MAKFSRIEVIVKMYETGLVPVFYNKDIDVCKKVVDACYNGGIRVFEFTNRGDFAQEVFSELNKYVVAKYDDLALGIGSVIDAGTSSLYMQIGANFVVSPILNKEMALVVVRYRKYPRQNLWVLK